MPIDPLIAEARECRELLRTHPAAGRVQLDALVDREARSTLHRGIAYLLRGCEAFFAGRYVEAEGHGTHSHAVALGGDLPLLAAEAAVLVGNVHLERGDYDDASTWYAEAAEHFASADALEELGRVYNNLGLVAWRLRDLPRAEAHYRHALDLYGPDAPPSIRATLLNNLGLVHEDAGNPAGAEEAWRRAIAILGDDADDQCLANALANLADLLIGRAAHDEARRLHERALSLRVRVGHQRGVVGSLVSLARISIARADDAASAYLDAALRLAEDIGLRKHQADAHALRAVVRERSGDLPGALADERRAAELRERVSGDEMTRRVAEVQRRFEAWQTRAGLRPAAPDRARPEPSDHAAPVGPHAEALRAHALAERLRATALDPDQRGLVEALVGATAALLAALDAHTPARPTTAPTGTN